MSANQQYQAEFDALAFRRYTSKVIEDFYHERVDPLQFILGYDEEGFVFIVPRGGEQHYKEEIEKVLQE